MSRLSRITFFWPSTCYRFSPLRASTNGGGGGGSFSQGEVLKAKIIARFFTLAFSCLKEGRTLAWQIPEKFGKEINEETKRRIMKEENFAVCISVSPGNYPSLEELELLARIPLDDQKGVLEEVGKLINGRINTFLNVFSSEYQLAMLGDIFSKGYSPSWFEEVCQKILAYFAYAEGADLLSLIEKFKAGHKFEIAQQYMELLIKLGKIDKALIFSLGLLEKLSSSECIGSDLAKPVNFFSMMFPLLEKIIPGFRAENGLSLLIKKYKESDPAQADKDLLVAAGFFYPKEMIRKAAELERPEIAFLLRFGHTLFEMHQNWSQARAKFMEFLQQVRMEVREQEILKVIGEEVDRQLRNPALSWMLQDLRGEGELNESKGLVQSSLSSVPLARINVREKILTEELEAAVDPVAIFLRDQVRKSGKLLLFTRNIALREFEDIVDTGKMRTNGKGLKYFRYGLGHEYGEEGAVIVVVMKPSFWEAEKEKSKLCNLFLHEVSGQKIFPKVKILNPDAPITEQMVYFDPTIDGQEREEILRRLTHEVDYNCSLRQKPSGSASSKDALVVGRTIIMQDQDGYMGLYPQLEVNHDVSLDQVEKILVPEHLWEEVSRIAQRNPQLAGLLKKVESGKNKEEFLEEREKLGRRSRSQGGSFQPSFGYKSFYLFEQAYFRLVLESESSISRSTKDFVSEVGVLFEKYGYRGEYYRGWIFVAPKDGSSLFRESSGDWKVFVNPRKEKFMEVLEVVLSVLKRKKPGIEFKIPADLSSEWRPGRKFGESSDTPKIVIYVNEETLPEVIRALDEELREKGLSSAGFGEKPGPSFSRRYGFTDLLFYKKEHFVGRGKEERAIIADKVEARARNAGITDPEIILELKKSALIVAGFDGENFYKRLDEVDPLEDLSFRKK